jgi:hypothetical protein
LNFHVCVWRRSWNITKYATDSVCTLAKTAAARE